MINEKFPDIDNSGNIKRADTILFPVQFSFDRLQIFNGFLFSVTFWNNLHISHS